MSIEGELKMKSEYFLPRTTVMGVPIFSMIAPFPISCFAGALISDISYYNSANVQWSNFSAWTLAIGEFFLGLLILITFIDIIRASRPRPWLAWLQLVVYVIVFALVMLDNFVHARDGWTAVVPQGLALTAVSVVLMIVAAFIGTRTFRPGINGE